MAAKYKSKESQAEMKMSQNSNTELYLLDEELSGNDLPQYPHCKLPAHYFDLLLHKKGVAIPTAVMQQKIYSYSELR